MPSQQFIPGFAAALHASPTTQANALRALAMVGETVVEKEPRTAAAAALLIGAEWAGERWTKQDVALATGVPEPAVARQYAIMASALKRAQK